MNNIRSCIHNLIKMLVTGRQDGRPRRSARVLAVIVVFVTTYMLILPGFTLDAKMAESQGGIDVPESALASDDADEADETEPVSDADESAQNDASSESQAADKAGLEYKGDGYTIVVDDSKAPLPADTQLSVTEIDKETDPEAYTELFDKADEAVRTEEGVDRDKTQKITFAKFYDIKFMSEGREITPDDAVIVTIKYDTDIQKDLKVEKKDDVRIIHFAEDEKTGDTEPEILDSDKVDATVKKHKVEETSFDAETFSVYAVVGTTLEENILTEDGHNYKVTVNYGPEAGVPDGAALSVSEITDSDDDYLDYINRSEKALGWDEGSASYSRLFDIKIVDSNGDKVEITSPVDVKIELEDKEAGDDLPETKVVHFADGSRSGDVVSNVDVEGKTVSFEAEGFSAYAIVQGPDAVPSGYSKISTLSDLGKYTAEGMYIGHYNGYYLKNAVVPYKSNNNVLGIEKTSQMSYPADSTGAAKYYFEPVEGAENQYYIYCYDSSNQKQYVYNQNTDSLQLSSDPKTAYAVTVNNAGRFSFKAADNNRYWNMWGGANGNIFAAYNKLDDGGYFYIWRAAEAAGDPYGLNGKSYGLMNWNGGTAGKAMMASEGSSDNLEALQLTVMSKLGNNDKKNKLFVPNDSDISMWTFEWIEDDKYYLTSIVDGSKKYLSVSSGGLSLKSDPDDSCRIQVAPGTGTHAGEISLKSGNRTLTYSGSIENGFKTGGSAGTEWLKLVQMSDLTSDYFLTHTAEKVSVSDKTKVPNGAHVIVYTRVWNDEAKRYDFYAVDNDGSLTPVYESGDDIQWVGPRLNTLLWDFTEYYWEGTTDPNYYYELYNEYSEKYIAPQVTGGQILSDNTIGINLNGRKNGEYYTPILAWDDANYAYVGLKADLSTGKIVSCSREEADDFYFAIVQDIPADDVLHTVPTVNHTDYGITVKLVDFGGKTGKYNGSASETTEVQQNVMGNSYWSNATDGFATPNLVSTDLKENGYPEATITHKSLSELFGDAKPVNNLFISSTYHSSGYFEYDSTQNFAHLNNDGKFTVYQEIGSFNKSGAVYQHGQFMPFNDIAAGKFSGNLNTTTSTNDQLSSTDPRKYEQLYQIDNPNYYFGMEIEASFTQTENGLDDWGHDIIYEFTGDDDFWLYVDGELIIDLGGLHKALSGSVNYSTGVIKYVDGAGKTYVTNLREQFKNNYKKRNRDATEDEVNDYLSQYFDDRKNIFKDYTTHKMKIFYMERGAGASNLHMRFNLASVKPGTVELSKELTGVTEQKAVLAEYPYQIYYTPKNGSGEIQLKNSAHNPDQVYDYVFYKGTKNPVTYRQSVTTGGVSYSDVFLLKAGQTAEITFPEEIESYRIVECGIDSTIYDSVKVNGEDAIVTGVSEDAATIKNYGTKPESPDNRAQVKYTNHVSPDALRTINITKRLYREDGETELSYSEDSSTFNFRLYLATEFEQSLDESPADMHIYYVKDASGNYCTWDAENGKFASTEISSLEGITDEQLRSLIFHTSMNGSISKIPAGYTVEVRDVLVGTRFKVVERENEMPDGYAFLKYKYSNNGSEPTDYESHENLKPASAGVEDSVISENDPKVYVCNIRGFGLRVNKVWSDKDYMIERDPIYFALYTCGDSDALTLVPGSGRRMVYGTDSLYWYYLQLPVAGVAFDNYEIREVSVIENPVIDENGVVADASITGIIEKNSVIQLGGTQKGESQKGSFPYTVSYEKGTPTSDTHVRVDTVTNSRPGIVIRKTDWAGGPLEGAEFTLKEGTDNLIGTFTSDKNGLVTVAFLSDNKTYTLTETKAPKNYHGLEKPLNISVEGTNVTVTTDGDADYYRIQQGTGGSMPALIIKNRSYSFNAKKIDDNGDPIKGAKFALYKKRTVVDATNYELLDGYDNLSSNNNGIIEKINETLMPGSYELKENSTIAGYQKLEQGIRFTISETGAITFDSPVPEGIEMKTEPAGADESSIHYTLEIPNHLKLHLKKVDEKNKALTGARFSLKKLNANNVWEAVEDYGNIDLTNVSEADLIGLKNGRYQLVETNAPDGYVILNKEVYFSVGNGKITLTDKDGNKSSVPGVTLSNGNRTITVANTPGAELPSTGGSGTTLFYIFGCILILGSGVLLWMRRSLM